MRKIESYKSIAEAVAALDNGGRFYNVLSKGGDGIINKSELGKVGGIFNDKQKMILFLELSMAHFDQLQKDTILSKLDKKLKITYQNFKPQLLLPSQVNEAGVISSNAIISGIPTLLDPSSDANGFILISVMSGQAMTFTLVPITEKYDTYILKEEESDEPFLIALTKGSGKLPNKRIKIAGVLKELKANRNEKNSSRKFLEAIYYLEST